MGDNANSNTVPVSASVKSCMVAVLGLLTVALFNTDWRYVTVAQDVMHNLNFSEQGRYWQGSSEGVFLKTNPQIIMLDRGAGRQTFLRQSVVMPVGFGFMRIGADIRVTNQVTGPKWWERAGVLIYSIDEKGKRMPFWPSRIALPEMSDTWRRHEAVIPVAADARRMDLYLFMGAKQGVLAVRNLTVTGQDNAAWFTAVRFILAAAWVMTGLWIVVPLIASRWKHITAALALFIFLGTLAGVMAPQPELSNFLFGIRNAVDYATRSLPVQEAREAPAKPPATPGLTVEDANEEEIANEDGARSAPDSAARGTSARIIDAMPRALTRDNGAFTAHFFVHATLAFLILLTFRQTSFIHLLAYLLLTGVSTEIIQYFVTTRTVNLADGASNTAGIVSGAVLGLAWIVLAHHRPRRAGIEAEEEPR